MSSLKEYVMISQKKRKTERYYKDANGNRVLSESDEANPAIMIDSINCRLTHSEVYDKVEDI